MTAKEKDRKLEWPDKVGKKARRKEESARRKLKILERTTPVRVKVKRLEKREKEDHSPRDVNRTGWKQKQGRQKQRKVGGLIQNEGEKPTRSIQTKIRMYLDSTKVWKDSAVLNREIVMYCTKINLHIVLRYFESS